MAAEVLRIVAAAELVEFGLACLVEGVGVWSGWRTD